MKRLVLGLLLAWTAVACAAPPPPPPISYADSLPVGAKASCALLPKLVELPFRPTDPAVDPVYRLLKEHRGDVKTCLEDSITNTTLMPDPRHLVKVDDFTVGDLAYILLVHYYDIPFAELWPSDAQADYRNRGAAAYSDWIRKPGSRAYLQRRVRARLINAEPANRKQAP